MLRRLHSLPGLVFGLILLVLAGTGAVLSLDPALSALSQPAGPAISVAELAARVQAANPGVSQIDRSPGGGITATVEGDNGSQSLRIDPASGAALGPVQASPVMTWVKNLHRSFLLGDTGRAAAGISAGAMTALLVTGLALLAAALGGWRKLGRRVRARGAGGWHMRAARVVLAGTAVSALTGVMMSLASFGLIDDGSNAAAKFPDAVSGLAAQPVGQLQALQQVPLADLRSLTFAVADDPTDAYDLITASGEGYVDPGNGQMLNWLPNSTARQVWETVYMLHTGQGLWWFGLLLGSSALGVPLLSVTGTLIWWGRRRAHPAIKGNTPAREAEVVVLVGSETGTTWGFAATLQDALRAEGVAVHVGAMSALADYPKARALILMAATYGDGAAPASAARFLTRLPQAMPRVPTAVLGFGDRMFANYCGYADQVSAALRAGGVPQLMADGRIDRQSIGDFAAWGQDLAQALGLPLVLEHVAHVPHLTEFELISREDFGQEVQHPASILRFQPRRGRGLWNRLFPMPKFAAGDLLGILPEGGNVPRLYSLASSRGDGVVEICVRKMPGGLCSGLLHGLQPGDRVRGFVRHNPDFRPQPGRAPVILVAAGCGVGPMAGFLRRNRRGRPMELYFGARDPRSDFLYRQDLSKWLADRRLTRLRTAFSRVQDRHYVQDRLRQDAGHLRQQIARGGQVLVCGSMRMARDVAREFEAALAPLGLTVARLKAEGRYLEDVY